MSTPELPWIGCPLCVTTLTTVKNLPGEICVACGRLMDDPIFETIVGHLACCDPAKPGVPSKCNVHVCRDCHRGPIMLSSGVVSSKEVSRVWFTGYTCKECGRTAAPDGVICLSIKCTGKEISMVWDTRTHMKCLNCEQTLDARTPDFACDCGEDVKTAYIGQPRVLSDRRRPRSPSPQNSNPEPSSGPNGKRDEDVQRRDKQTQTLGGKTSKMALRSRLKRLLCAMARRRKNEKK